MSVLVDTPQRALTGSVDRFAPDDITIRIKAKRMPALPPGTLCAVSLAPEGESMVFLTPVTRIVSLPPTIVVTMPSEAISMKARRTMRIPVLGLPGLGVSLVDGERRYTARAIDVSMGGLRATVTDSSPRWQTNHTVWVHLTWENDEISLRARVVWAHAPTFGLLFSDLADSAHLGDLTRVVCDLERIWLSDVEEGLRLPG